ncbi:MAG: acetyl-CoA carboxylase carboxyltransferase subunit alpha, partial [Oceanococcaceae bacterium]
EGKIEQLRQVADGSIVNLSDEIARLQKRVSTLTEEIFAQLTPWQVTQVARHPLRPYMLDYVEHLFTEYTELRGDRHFRDDRALIGGLARFHGQPVMVIGHQKGRSTQEKVERNFGMPKPEGYRKALRLMQMAEKFNLPIFTFIDTPGAYPGIGAEERNQSEAIARNLLEMSRLRTPIICTVIGEGGSGGALAVGVGDHVSMLQYSVYSVISPEGCASILWKKASHAEEAAAAMGMTAGSVKKAGLIDEVIAEPAGGAHRDREAMYATLDERLRAALDMTLGMPRAELLQRRRERLLAPGEYVEVD